MKHDTSDADYAITLRPRETEDLELLESSYYLWSGWKRRHWPADIVRPGLRLYGFDTESRRFCVLLEVTKGGSFTYQTRKEFADRVLELTGWEPDQDDPHWPKIPVAEAGKHCTGLAIRWRVIKPVSIAWPDRFSQLGWERLGSTKLIPNIEPSVNYWRMAFRVGSQGDEMWPDCRKRGIAAIGYYTAYGEPIVGDCSKLTEDEYNEIWRRKDPKNSTGRASLRNVAYRMKVGDVIYVKQGPYIVGRGKVTGKYQYNLNILKGTASEWEHFVRVGWEPDFHPIRISLEAEQTTVLQLSGERLQKLKAAIALSNQQSTETIVAQDLDSLHAEEASFQEGPKKQRFTNYYERNPKLRTAAILCHGTKCTICGFDFEAIYGKHGTGYIEVHHLRPVSKLEKETTVNPKTDMAVVCSNCHRMIHRKKDKVLSLKEMRGLLQKSNQGHAHR